MQILGSTALAGRKRMTVLVLVLGRKQRHVAVAASSYQFYERARRTTRFYFPRFRDIACMRVLCTHTDAIPFMHASRVDLERFMLGARCNETSSLPLFLVKTTTCEIISDVLVNSASAIRPDFTLLNIYGREILDRICGIRMTK